ncbi:unnamed protein product [Ranitomeya imitator]|uniref:Major intrinsically disordered Notch2-binding receptor 1-like C-terminal domain-containing protein n=1 Tax=Ranitomeya imitator TaxID=111125 RepID=A0ABN9KZS0_9NEOB|nr:unnamed protein product [Ranitomeya imitator]
MDPGNIFEFEMAGGGKGLDMWLEREGRVEDHPEAPSMRDWLSEQPLTLMDRSGGGTQESLNPNNLEFWMEDIYTPGYDSLLKRKEAEFRRTKVCKMAALITAAACTVILVIVVPICTMKS